MGSGQLSSTRNPNRKFLFLTIPLACGLLVCVSLVSAWYIEKPNIRVVVRTPTPTVQVTVLPGPRPARALESPPTLTPTGMPASSRPTPTNTQVVKGQIAQTATVRAISRATIEADHKALVMAQLNSLSAGSRKARSQAGPPISFSRSDRVVLAHYFAWYDGDGWNDCNISAGDRPLQPYNSDNPAAIANHIKLAQEIGLNGFTLHWFAPGDRTDNNFRSLLSLAEGSDFAATVVFSRHIFHGPPATEQDIEQALRYIIDQHSHHPNFLRLEQKPVIFFTDVYRTPTHNRQSPQQFWDGMRARLDPGRQNWWIAEGLDASYLSVFDGLFVFKISHAAYPHDYVKSPRWGRQVRAMAQQTGQPKLWLATISPGWDDRRSVCRADVRVANTPHQLDRAEGATYEATFQAALQSNPDWLIVSSFNEWVEGSYIEPSEQYGDRYLRLTQEFIDQFQAR